MSERCIQERDRGRNELRAGGLCLRLGISSRSSLSTAALEMKRGAKKGGGGNGGTVRARRSPLFHPYLPAVQYVKQTL
ncbi:hypothetical protein NQZ68_017337 [Dissostichus eleginoides]|nr:hypothetical protein NQZ68_017337 [Dissostichus eleginoides]